MISKDLLELVKKYEGCRLQAYTDPIGIWTIGYGHTANVVPNMVITQQAADQLLTEDLEKFQKGVKQLINVPLKQCQIDALTSFSFNVGLGNLQKSTLLKKVNNSDLEGASKEFEKWNKAGGKVLNGLVKRREAEKELFLKEGADMVHTFSVKMDGNKQISKNFKVSEFRCKDGSDLVMIDTDFVISKLQRIRDHFNVPVTLNSAYRTPSYNNKIGGATNSYHTKGRAFDIVVKGVPVEEVAKYAVSIGIKGVIKYNTFTHIDSREKEYHATNNNGKVTLGI